MTSPHHGRPRSPERMPFAICHLPIANCIPITLCFILTFQSLIVLGCVSAIPIRIKWVSPGRPFVGPAKSAAHPGPLQDRSPSCLSTRYPKTACRHCFSHSHFTPTLFCFALYRHLSPTRRPPDRSPKGAAIRPPCETTNTTAASSSETKRFAKRSPTTLVFSNTRCKWSCPGPRFTLRFPQSPRPVSNQPPYHSHPTGTRTRCGCQNQS